MSNGTENAGSGIPQRPREKMVPTDSLVEWQDNPRVNDAAAQTLAEGMQRWGFLDAIIARKSDHRVIAGHARLKAARQKGIRTVPVIFLDLDDADSAELAVFHNRAAENAEWDAAKLLGLGVDLNAAGFSEAQIEEMREALDPGEAGTRERKEMDAGGIATRRPAFTLHLFVEESGQLEAALVAAAQPGESRGATVLRALRAMGPS